MSQPSNVTGPNFPKPQALKFLMLASRNTCEISRAFYYSYTNESFPVASNSLLEKLDIGLAEQKIVEQDLGDEEVSAALNGVRSHIDFHKNLYKSMKRKDNYLLQEAQIIMFSMQQSYYAVEQKVERRLRYLGLDVNGVELNPQLLAWLVIPDIPSTTPVEPVVRVSDNQKMDDLIDKAMEEDSRPKAIELLKRALKYDRQGPLAGKAFSFLALLYEEQGNTSEAIENYTNALNISGVFAEGLYKRGLLYFKLGQITLAKQDLAEALQLNKDAELSLEQVQRITEILSS